MYKKFLLTMIIIIISGCGVALNVERINPKLIDHSDKTLVFLDSHEWDMELQKALRKNGFSIKKFASQKIVQEKTTGTRKEIFREAGARYGLDYSYDMGDYCFGGGALFRKFTVEISDLTTNDIILTVEKGGYSEGCPGANGTLFSDLARTLSNEWHP